MSDTTVHDRAVGAIMGPSSATPWALGRTGTTVSASFAAPGRSGPSPRRALRLAGRSPHPLVYGSGTLGVRSCNATCRDVVPSKYCITRPDPKAELGGRLAPLRKEGILVVGSGNVVHNLYTCAWGRHAAEPYDWAVRFEKRARELMLAADHEPLVACDRLGRDAMLSIPTSDHYLPLLYVLGLCGEREPVSFPLEGVDGGSVSMLAVEIG